MNLSTGIVTLLMVSGLLMASSANAVNVDGGLYQTDASADVLVQKASLKHGGSANAGGGHTITWTMVNHSSTPVAYTFYVPNGGQLADGGRITGIYDTASQPRVTISCVEGSRVCYGAWEINNKDITWGVGLGSDSCTDCCVQCGRHPTMHLID